ncbi:DNA-binding protein HU [bacterium HR07]|nr:DNA-binding protein HU [bacterium HR07]
MIKLELVAQVSQRTGVPKETVLKSLNAALAVIAETLARGEEVRLKKFGTFCVRPRHATRRSNLWTRQLFSVPSKAMPRFYPAKFLKQLTADRLTVVELPSGRLGVRRKE